MNDENEKYLQHHGIKGMKWGVRRTPEQLGHKPSSKKKGSSVGSTLKKAGSAVVSTSKSVVNAGKKKLDERAKKKAVKMESASLQKKKETKTSTKNSHISSMSDDELRRVVQRLSLEKQYKQLTPQKKTAQEKVAKFLKTSGKVAVTAIAIGEVYGGAKALGKKYNLSDKQTDDLEKLLKTIKILGRG